MAVTKKFYLMTVGGGQRKIKLPEYYDSVDTALGLTAAPDNSTAQLTSARDLLKSGDGVKIRVRRKIGDTKYATSTIICDLDNAKAAMSALLGKTFGTGSVAGAGTIVSAYFPSRSRLG